MRSPLAPKMMMEQGSSALRSALMLPHGGSSGEIRCIHGDNNGASSGQIQRFLWRGISKIVGFKNCSPGAAFFRKFLRQLRLLSANESENHHHPKEGRA